jgi:23S rRNA maturation-related 3'-5' exoribonuclease YhaM
MVKMEEIQVRIEEFLSQLIPETIQRIYEHWTERLQQVIYTDRDSVQNQIQGVHLCSVLISF